jgi:hypothetical protein
VPGSNHTNAFAYPLHDKPMSFARSIELAGVAQIPDDVEQTIGKGWEDALTADQMDRANAIIWGLATREIQKRHQELKLEENYQ